MPRIDEEIKQDVVDQLVWDERVNAAQVNVEVHGGTVVLRGVTPSYWSKMAAVEDAELIPGVERVDDQLTIEWSGIAPSDTNLRANIELALQWHPNLDASHMAIDVSDGVVSLEGSVDSLWKKLRTERLVFDVPGVVDVENQLAIVPTQTIRDETIAVQIIHALKRNILVDEKRVDVGVSDGVVTLSGSVPNGAALRAARNAAYYTEGVVDVQDNLVVLS